MKNAFILFLVYLFCPFLLHAQDESVDIKFKIQNDELIAGANKNNFSVFATGPDNIVSPASGSFTNAHERTKILRDSSLLYSWDQVKNEWSLKAYYRTKYSYDEKFRLTDCINYRTDYFSGSVVPTQEYKSVYDSNNNLIYEHRKNFSSDWYSPPSSFDSMEYVNNILTIQKSFVFDRKEKIWISCGVQHFDDLGCRIDNSEIRYAMVYIPNICLKQKFSNTAPLIYQPDTVLQSYIFELFDKTGTLEVLWPTNYPTIPTYESVLSQKLINKKGYAFAVLLGQRVNSNELPLIYKIDKEPSFLEKIIKKIKNNF